MTASHGHQDDGGRRRGGRGACARAIALVVCAGVSLAAGSGCGRAKGPSRNASRARSEQVVAGAPIELPQADQQLCTAVAVLVDTSGSMNHPPAARSGERPKFQIARTALERIVRHTAEWKGAHPDRTLQMGIYRFSSSAAPVLEMGEFDAERAQAAIATIPPPSGNTAIGQALVDGFRALYKSGCVRKYIVCVTDGENTAGPRPDLIARQLHAQTEGDVEIHFVAFDTSARHFAFLRDVRGYVVEAADAAQLEARLSEIYEKRILAEAMPAEQPAGRDN